MVLSQMQVEVSGRLGQLNGLPLVHLHGLLADGQPAGAWTTTCLRPPGWSAVTALFPQVCELLDSELLLALITYLLVALAYHVLLEQAAESENNNNNK